MSLPRAKIVCTIGPACRSPAILKRLVAEGMDVARLNFSFSERDEHRRACGAIRSLAEEQGRTVAILQDLQGSKVRLHLAAPRVQVSAGDVFYLLAEGEPGSPEEGSLNSPELVEALKPGYRVILADGTLELEVESQTDGRVRCTVLRRGQLREGMGVTVPRAAMDLPGLTEKDRSDLSVGLEMGVDMVALSFVRSGADLAALRAMMAELGQVLPMVAKIELAQALEHLDGILEESAALMVARGDLGIQLPPEEVPFHQKAIIARCNDRGVPVITATQMLESMVREPRPTRAEASDVANAVLDGTDAVMLSAETAAGLYPVDAVVTMRRILDEAARHFPHDRWFQRASLGAGRLDTTASVAQAATDLALSVGARAIITTTTTGHTARMVARFRPPMPILAVTPNPATARRLALVWGVTPLLAPDFAGTDEMLESCVLLARERGYLASGDRAVLTAGVPLGTPGTTNLIKLQVVEG